MLTVDDCNTIREKYKAGYWIEVDLSEIPIETLIDMGVFKVYIDYYDFADTYQFRIQYGDMSLIRGIYCINHDGEVLTDMPISYDDYNNRWDVNVENDVSDVICKILVNSDIPSSDEYNTNTPAFIPISSPIIEVINGEFDDKFYIQRIYNPIQHTGNAVCTIDGEEVELETDEQGTYITLPSSDIRTIGGYWKSSMTGQEFIYIPFHVTFREFKELPIPYIPTLYKGTPQSIQILNSKNDDPISDYQTYYQGIQLKDNTIHLPYDADDYINIIVDLKDYRYPFCTVKLKAPTTLYQADSQSDVETAIENGIQTLQIGDNETEVTLNAIELSNVTLINSNIQVSESILTDCQIINSTYTDNGGNNITSTIFKDTDYNTTAQSNYNETTFNECNIHDSEINLTGTVNDCTITDTLIISDGIINIRDNTFTGVGAKEYFPSHLYLTGDYTVTGNTFTLEGEWTELEYNMCIIKATNDFNPSQFINNNTLHLNITYQDEPVNTFYYNIVDEDKIRAVRLN